MLTLSDRLTMYRWAVQDPETHAIVLRLMHHQMNAGSRNPPTATTLREDFAGTSADATAWIALDPAASRPDLPPRRAVAIDLDAPTLGWARERAKRLLGPRHENLTFMHDDVLHVGPPRVAPADITSALNFSVLYLTDAGTLGAYLESARRGLAPGGILVMNLFGGQAALSPGTTTTRVTPRPRLPVETPIEPFDYHWIVRSFDLQTRRFSAAIRFSHPADTGADDGDAFTYDWRVWTPEELIQTCRQAGFEVAQLWRHTHNGSGAPGGAFLGPVAPGSVERLDSWTGYIVAWVGGGAPL